MLVLAVTNDFDDAATAGTKVLLEGRYRLGIAFRSANIAHLLKHDRFALATTATLATNSTYHR